MGLEGIVFLVIISIVRKDRGTGGCLHVDGGIIGVLLTKERVIILSLGISRILMT
jgi:hypothetical protein